MPEHEQILIPSTGTERKLIRGREDKLTRQLGTIAILPETAPGPHGWMDDALCAQTDPEAFILEKGKSAKSAKEVCAECTVREQCLEYALATEQIGIWGGLSDRERRKLAKKRAA